MNIQHIHGVAPLYTNTFLIITNAKHGILIDAAAEPGVYLKALDEADATLTHILLTHGHYDHVGAVAALKKATGCKVYMDPVDAQGSQLLLRTAVQRRHAVCRLLRADGFPRRQHAGDGKKPVPAGRAAAAGCNKSPART